MKLDEPYLQDILGEIGKLEQFTIKGRDEFLRDTMAQYAVLHAIQIIGEAVKRLSAEAKATHPAIPWKTIAGMRDIIVHDYAGVKLDLVWDTVFDDIPVLKLAIQALLSKLN